MKCIFSQGNPEDLYGATRHNIGFVCLDSYAKNLGASFTPKSKFFANVAETSYGGEKILLVKPSTFYNDTGRSVRAIKDFYKLDNADILVIHDDLALDFGKIRIRHRGSDAGNNGIKSLNAAIGEDYARLRIGILNDLRQRIPDADFVLSKFTSSERVAVTEKITPAVSNLIETFVVSGLADESFNLLQDT